MLGTTHINIKYTWSKQHTSSSHTIMPITARWSLLQSSTLSPSELFLVSSYILQWFSSHISGTAIQNIFILPFNIYWITTMCLAMCYKLNKCWRIHGEQNIRFLHSGNISSAPTYCPNFLSGLISLLEASDLSFFSFSSSHVSQLIVNKSYWFGNHVRWSLPSPSWDGGKRGHCPGACTLENPLWPTSQVLPHEVKSLHKPTAMLSDSSVIYLHRLPGPLIPMQSSGLSTPGQTEM